MMEGALVVEASLYLTRPKSKCRKKDPLGFMVCSTRPDLDNFAKNLMDALNGIAWKDDGQVHSLKITKWYHEIGQGPRTEIQIEQL